MVGGVKLKRGGAAAAAAVVVVEAVEVEEELERSPRTGIPLKHKIKP